MCPEWTIAVIFCKEADSNVFMKLTVILSTIRHNHILESDYNAQQKYNCVVYNKLQRALMV